MGNFAVDVMWRSGIGICRWSRGAPSGDQRLSWDPFLSLYGASLRSLLSIVANYAICLSILICLPQTTKHTPLQQQQHTTHTHVPSNIFLLGYSFLPNRTRQLYISVCGRFFFFLPFAPDRRDNFGLHPRDSLETGNPLSRRAADYRWPGLTPRRSTGNSVCYGVQLSDLIDYYTENSGIFGSDFDLGSSIISIISIIIIIYYQS